MGGLLPEGNHLGLGRSGRPGAMACLSLQLDPPGHGNQIQHILAEEQEVVGKGNDGEQIVGEGVGHINNCESGDKKDCGKTNVGVNVGVNDENGGLNTESGGLNGGLNKNNCHEVIVNSRQKRIISLIKLKPTIIVEQMTSILSISKRSLERDLSMLQKEGIIRHEGSRKSGTWVVLEPYNSKE